MADTSDIGGSFGQISGSQGVTPTGPISPSQGPKKTGFSSQDSMSTADIAAALAMMWTMNAESPVLVPPSEGSNKVGAVDGYAFVMSMCSKYHEICMHVLDAWAENIKAQVEAAKQLEKSPSHVAKVERERAIRLGLVQNVKDYAEQLKIDKNDGMLQSVASALVITGAFTGLLVKSVVDVASTPLVGITPQIDFSVNFASQALAPIAEDFRAQLGLIGAWAMGTMATYSILEATGEKPGKQIDDKTLANKYASKIISLLNSDQLNNFIMALLVNRTENGQPLSNERKAELSAVLKLILLASALAAIYKSKTGKITGEEFLELSDGTSMKPEEGIEAQLVQAIKMQFKDMDEDTKTKVLNALARYMDTDPKLAKLFNVGTTFDNVNENLVRPDAIKT